MTDEELKSVVQNAIAESVKFSDGTLSPDRAKATEYYSGKPFGNEEEGRSQVVLTKVRDTVDGMTPSLIRVAFGAEHAVEFTPTREDNVEQAEQKTDYVRYVFEQDNSGLLRALAVLKDGLVRKIGIFKWGWDEISDTKAYKQEGLDRQQLELLASDDEVELTKVVARKDQMYDVELTRTAKNGRARVWEIPPEEFGYNLQARSLDEAKVVYHRTDKTRGELLAMGVKKKDIDQYGAAAETDASLTGNPEDIARRDTAGVGKSPNTGTSNDPPLGEANDRILYTEAWMTIDYDGDGIAELRRICTIGPNFYPIKNDPAEERPFAVFTPWPEPHTLLGGSAADRTMDMQKVASSIIRGILDGAALSLFPRTVYKEGAASVADIMNTAIGDPIREREIGAVRNLETPWVGKDMIPLLDFVDQTIEGRTGKRKGAAGLDADALQSTTKEGVNAALSGDQEQMELIARVFAEMTLKPLFSGLGRMIQSRQPRSRMVRLRGKWIDADPKTWDANMDVVVNVSLGHSLEKKIATLTAVAQDQEKILQQLGLQNPATSLPKFLNTRAKILKMQGIYDFESYYNRLPNDWQPPPPPEPPQDPSIMAMQAEAEMSHVKAMKELAIKADELKLKLAEHDMKRQEMQDKRDQASVEQSNAEFEQRFKMEELAINTELERLKIEATIATTQASAALASSESEAQSSNNAAMAEVKQALSALASREPTINVHPPQVTVAAPPAPNVNIAPAEVTVNHQAPAEKKTRKRKGSITGPDGKKYTVESEGD